MKKRAGKDPGRQKRDRLCAKLRGQAGETIAETLIALLISALALTMLAGAISTAGNLITKSETMMVNYYNRLTALGNPTTSGLTVTVSNQTNSAVSFDGGTDDVAVNYAVNDAMSKPVLAYSKQTS